MVLEHITEDYIMTAWEPYKLPLWPCRMECYQQFIEALSAQLHQATTAKHPVWVLMWVMVM